MQTLESLKERIDTVGLLQSVVRTMKTLAAVSIRQHEKAIESLAEYSRTIDMGLSIILRGEIEETAEPYRFKDGNLGAVVIGSDQGLCGRFNEQLAAYALEQLRLMEPLAVRRTLVCVGTRAHMYLAESGENIADCLSAPVSTTGIIPTVQRILATIEEWQLQLHLKRIVLFYNHYLNGASYRPEILHLMPLDRTWLRSLADRPWQGETIPIFTMDRNRLFTLMIRQALFISLYRAFAESMASENAARLASMQAAERNIEERLEELSFQFRDLRQSNITEELIDIMAGFEALTGDRRA
jgi:F-type H+-transporting ATPase subunit gamma